MATKEEDFTFPTTTTTTTIGSSSPPRFLDSPPLWRPSSGHGKQEKPKGKEQVEEEEKLIKAKRRNPCLDQDDEDEDEEKMDMLWEDMNDESSRNNEKIGQKSDVCVKALKLSKANGKKKLSILVFINVLKKFFLMHHSHRTMKKSAW